MCLLGAYTFFKKVAKMNSYYRQDLKSCIPSIIIIFCTVLLFFPLVSTAFSEMYMWKDKNGNDFFSDSPQPGVDAKHKKVRKDKIEIPQMNIEDNIPQNSNTAESRLRDVRDINVILYMTDWCPYCSKAKLYLDSAGVNLTEYDIDKDQTTKEEMRKKSGSNGVPVIDVEGIIIRGYAPGAIQSAIQKRRSERK